MEFIIISSFPDHHHDQNPRFDDWHLTMHFCPKQCGRKYQSKTGLHNHLKYECGVDPQFKCEECGKSFSMKHHLKSHALNIHKRIIKTT